MSHSTGEPVLAYFDGDRISSYYNRYPCQPWQMPHPRILALIIAVADELREKDVSRQRSSYAGRNTELLSVCSYDILTGLLASSRPYYSLMAMMHLRCIFSQRMYPENSLTAFIILPDNLKQISCEFDTSKFHTNLAGRFVCALTP